MSVRHVINKLTLKNTVMTTILFYLGVFLSILFFSLIAKLAILGISETVKNIQSKN